MTEAADEAFRRATTQEDNLAEDLLNLLSKFEIPNLTSQDLIQELVQYVVARDHKIFVHAYDAGRASA